MILAVETSDILCSIAFYKDGRKLVEYNHELPMQHAMLIGELVGNGLRFLSDPLRRQRYTAEDLELVAVSIGPGSFTGLRIGLGYVQGFCFGRNLPVAAVSNHQVLARQRVDAGTGLYTLIEARRNEVYCAKHDLLENGYPRINKHFIIQKENLDETIPEKAQIVCRKELDIPEQVLQNLIQKDVIVNRSGLYSAGILAELADFRIDITGADALQDLEPMYIRPFAGVK